MSTSTTTTTKLEVMAMSPAERMKANILIVESDAHERNYIRTTLKSLGYGKFFDAPNHLAALEKMSGRAVTHVIFEAKKTNMPASDFLIKLFEVDSSIIAIPTSKNPNIDDVFELLIIGARGYIVRPFTSEGLELAILYASNGEPIADAVLNAKDRNEALVALTMSSLDKAATIIRQATQFDTAKREIPRSIALLKRSAELARTFSKGGEQGLLDALEKFCLERSKGPASKLGRLRQRLRGDRTKDEMGGEVEAG